ncbi:MAG: hypothetical protein AAF826_07730 [Pseudomonadota bacterium]
MKLFLKTSTLLAAIALYSSPAAALTKDELVEQLVSEGYSRIEVRRTLLGRTRVEALGVVGRRDIVLSAQGDILRDERETFEQPSAEVIQGIEEALGRSLTEDDLIDLLEDLDGDDLDDLDRDDFEDLADEFENDDDDGPDGGNDDDDDASDDRDDDDNGEDNDGGDGGDDD